jgi:hypothetical protein
MNNAVPYSGPARNRDVSKIAETINAGKVMPNSSGARVSNWNNGSIIHTPRFRQPFYPKSFPFKLSGLIDTNNVAKIFVKPGMVNNFIPTIKVSGIQVSLVAPSVPALVVTESNGVVYIKATVDSAGTITAIEILNALTLPPDTLNAKYRRIGSWTSSSGQFTSILSMLNTNQTLYLCNGSAIWES